MLALNVDFHGVYLALGEPEGPGESLGFFTRLSGARCATRAANVSIDRFLFSIYELLRFFQIFFLHGVSFPGLDCIEP